MSAPDPVTTGVALAAALQIAKQAQNFVAAAAGSPGESIGTILGNIAKRRLTNAEKVSNKAHLILLNIGQAPGEVPLNILQPALEAASVQEDRSLQEIWANLLANASDPRALIPVTAAFPTILKELGAREVSFLDKIYETARESVAGGQHTHITRIEFLPHELLPCYKGWTFGTLDSYYRQLRTTQVDLPDEFAFSLDLVLRNRLFHVGEKENSAARKFTIRDVDTEEHGALEVYSLTQLGVSFIRACRAPEPSSADGAA